MSTRFQPVFVVGCPRSGTTLLQQLIASHPDVFGLPESHFFSETHPASRLKRHCTWPGLLANGAVDRILTELGRRELRPCVRVSPFASRYAAGFVSLLEILCAETGKTMWVDKTPRHLHLIDEISRVVPRALFVHIVRRATPTIDSLHRTTRAHPALWKRKRWTLFRGYTRAQCARRWRGDVSTSARYLGRPGHEFVTYEGLVDDPEACARYLCDFLGLDFAVAMLRRRSAGFFDVAAEPWKRRNLDPAIRPPTRPAEAPAEADEGDYLLVQRAADQRVASARRALA